MFWFGWTDPSADMSDLDLWYEIAEPSVAAAPDDFTAGQWSINSDGDVTIATLPAASPSISDLEYRIEAGSAVSFSASTTGTYSTTATEGQDVQIRAVNSEGAGDWSDTKAVPAASSGLSAEWRNGEPDDYGGLTHIAQNSDGTTAVASNDDPIGWAEDVA